MQKGIKNISLLFLWTAGLVFLLHNFTPHHHHLDEGYQHKDLTGHFGGQSDDAPVHCHAFNNLAVYKTDEAAGKVSKSIILVASGTEDTTTYSAVGNPSGQLNFNTPERDTSAAVYLKNSPTRGSPSFA